MITRLNRDMDGQTEADFPTTDQSDALAQNAGCLQLLDTLPARRGRQRDLFRDLRHGDRRIALKDFYNFQVDPVHKRLAIHLGVKMFS